MCAFPSIYRAYQGRRVAKARLDKLYALHKLTVACVMNTTKKKNDPQHKSNQIIFCIYIYICIASYIVLARSNTNMRYMFMARGFIYLYINVYTLAATNTFR